LGLKKVTVAQEVVLAHIFFVGIWTWLADKLHFILSCEAGFYKPTVLKVNPPFCRIKHMQQWQVNFQAIFAPGF
jgi:hypothetical protein